MEKGDLVKWNSEGMILSGMIKKESSSPVVEIHNVEYNGTEINGLYHVQKDKLKLL